MKKTQPGRNGGTLKADAGPGRPKGSVSLLGELKKQLDEGETAQMLIKAMILQAARGNGAAMKLVWDRIEGPVPTEITGADGSPLFPSTDLAKLSKEELKAWHELAVKATPELPPAD